MGDEWDDRAATFDDEPDHGLRDPQVRDAWADPMFPAMNGRPSTGRRRADSGAPGRALS
jgi:hypothetical protein